MFGEVPRWYTVVRAARYLGVPPWELLDRPVYWMRVALASEDAEAHAAEHQQKAAARKKG